MSEHWYSEYPVALRIAVVIMVVVATAFAVVLGMNYGLFAGLLFALVASVIGVALVKRDIDHRAELQRAADARNGPSGANRGAGPFRPRRSSEAETEEA